MAGIDEITRVLDNLYKRVFEQGKPSQNRVMSNAQVVADDMLAETDTGSIGSSVTAGFEIPVTTRWYGPLTIAAADADAGTSIFKITTATGRVQYGAGVLDETALTLVFRVRADASSATMAAGHLFRWGAGANDFLSCRWSGAGGNWQIQRSATGGAAAQSQTVAGSFASGDHITLGFKFTASTIGVSVNGGAFSMGGGSSDIPTLADVLFDLLSNQGASEWFNGGLYWCLIAPSGLTDAQIAAIHATGDTDPEWNGTILNGINLSLLWHCDDANSVVAGGVTLTGVQYHEQMSNRWGEGNWN